jgi:hypothetical protein
MAVREPRLQALHAFVVDGIEPLVPECGHKCFSM